MALVDNSADVAMRSVSIAAILGSLVSLSACAAGQQTETTAPTVSYAYNHDDDYDVIRKKADLYCEEQYDKDAVLLDRGLESDDYKATFACK